MQLISSFILIHFPSYFNQSLIVSRSSRCPFFVGNTSAIRSLYLIQIIGHRKEREKSPVLRICARALIAYSASCPPQRSDWWVPARNFNRNPLLNLEDNFSECIFLSPLSWHVENRIRAGFASCSGQLNSSSAPMSAHFYQRKILSLFPFSLLFRSEPFGSLLIKSAQTFL